MKIFVTGGSGFIGQRIVDNLLQKGYELVCLTHQKELDRSGIETVHGDLLEKDMLAGMKDCDAVIANAAICVIGPDDATREIMRDVNVAGTKNTLDLAVELGIPKIVYTSTIGVFGDITPYGVATEEDVASYAAPCCALYDETKR